MASQESLPHGSKRVACPRWFVSSRKWNVRLLFVFVAVVVFELLKFRMKMFPLMIQMLDVLIFAEGL